MSEAHKRTPRPVPERGDVRNFPLSPTDGYVLSRVSGALERSRPHRVDGPARGPGAGLAGEARDAGSHHVRRRLPRPLRRIASRTGHSRPLRRCRFARLRPPRPPDPDGRRPPRTSNSTPSSRGAWCDVHREIQQLDHYALLGVDPKADKKAIKRAYYELAAVFHPDQYFRKTPGLLQGPDGGHLLAVDPRARHAVGRGDAHRVRRVPRGAAPRAGDRGRSGRGPPAGSASRGDDRALDPGAASPGVRPAAGRAGDRHAADTSARPRPP